MSDHHTPTPLEHAACLRPATRNETRYVLAELADAGSYMISMGHRVEGILDPDLLRNAFEEVVRRHESLRTVFSLVDRKVLAEVCSSPSFAFHHVRMEEADPERFRVWALPLVFTDVRPDAPGSLVRLLVAETKDYWRFTVAMHHAVSDGFSRGVVNRELLKLYAGEALAAAGSYARYAVSPAAGDAGTASVAAFPVPARVPGDGCTNSEAELRGLFVEREATRLAVPLKSAARAQGVSKFAFLAAVYGLGLRAFTKETAVSSFFQSEGRQVLGAPNSVVGPFSNTLPLDLSLSDDQRFADYVRAVGGRLEVSLALETSDFTEHLAQAGKAPTVSLNMFPPAPRIRAGDLAVGPREFLDRRTEYDLNLVWSEDSGVIRARAFHDGGRLSPARVSAFVELQIRLLEAAFADPEASCGRILRDAQRHGSARIGRVSEEAPPPGRIHEAFFRLAGTSPGNPAIVTTEGQWSYGDLAWRARAHAAVLREAGADPAAAVAILSRRSPELVAAMLGVSAFGAPFAVIDAGYSEDRIEVMLAEMGARHMVLAGAPAPDRAARGVTILASGQGCGAEPGDGETTSRAVAYQLFTSGTTGSPKRVHHPDATLMRFVSWQAETLGGQRPFRTMLLAGLSHDPVMRDIFLPLSNGGAVVLPHEDEMRDPKALRRLLERGAPDVLHLTPATGKLIAAGIEDDRCLASIRAVFWGGDRLEPARVADWRSLAPKARQFNLYGSTETPQAALIHEIALGEERGDRIAVGRPVPWAGVRMEQNGSLVAPGCVGEIVIELGDPVAGTRGADGTIRLEPSSEHFTGDLGFLLPGVGVQVIGRSDDQVKINSLRIELSEISHCAEQIEGVAQAVTLLEGQSLTLYLVSGPGSPPERKVREALARALPSYMVPRRIVFAESIPLTRNGKVDRAALQAIVPQDPGGPRHVEPPRGAAEARIASIFASYTGLSVDDRQASLADLGADSLSSIEVRLAFEGLGLDLPQGWEWLPVADLAVRLPREGDVVQSPFSWLKLRRLDSFLVLRFLAIAAIVSHHSGMDWMGGASVMLIALAGFGFGKLQLRSILGDGRTGRVWATLLKLLTPLVPASIAIFAAHSYLGNDPHPSVLLFYVNIAGFVDDILLGNDNTWHQIEWLWFLHLYLQMFLVVALLLSVRPLREAIAVDPWRAVLVFFLITEIAALAVIYGAFLVNGDLGHVAALLRRSLTTLMPVLVLGALLSLAETRGRILVTGAAILAHLALQNLGPLGGDEGLWVAALALTVIVPSVYLPGLVAVGLLAVSAEALIIYLSHRATLFALEGVLGFAPTVTIGVITALAVGVFLGKGLRPIVARVGTERLSRMRIST